MIYANYIAITATRGSVSFITITPLLYMYQCDIMGISVCVCVQLTIFQ